jgi:hypothetical protein
MYDERIPEQAEDDKRSDEDSDEVEAHRYFSASEDAGKHFRTGEDEPGKHFRSKPDDPGMRNKKH